MRNCKRGEGRGERVIGESTERGQREDRERERDREGREIVVRMMDENY